MAITNAQQYKQLFSKGGRIGFQGGGADLGAGASGMGSGQAAPGPGDTGGAGGYGKDTNQFSDTGGDGVQRDTGLESIRQQKIKDQIKEELLLTPIGRNKPLNRLSLFNNRYQRDRLINLAKKRTDQKYRDLEDYVVGDTDEDYDFTGLPEGLKDLKTTTGTRPNLYDVNSTMNIPSMLSLVQDKIRPDTQVTAQNTLNKARDYRDLVSNVSNMTNQEIRDTMTDLANRGKTEDQINPRDGDGGNQILPITPYQQSIVAQEPEEELTELQQMIADRGLLARRFAADGGIMDIIGGAADGNLDEMGRQMYGLGKLVKKATRAVKKIVKSPVGKAALAFGAYKLGGGLLKNDSIRNFLFAGKDPSFANLTSKGVLAGIGGISALSGLMSQPEEDEEEETYYRGPNLDLAAIRRNPYGSKGSAYGFYAEGGNVKEPVAKDTMPLLDMNGMEKDYRADGGFVPIGRMEKADDVPARLSKNEFVFTADAVRNAGDGDVDKGAEVMYNMMKNLESGGKVSEESQGLDGARDMFQTSKRLEEVL